MASRQQPGKARFAGPLRLAMALAVAPCPAVALDAAHLGSAATDRLAAGGTVVEVVPVDDSAGQIEALIDIPAPPERVWNVMLDCARAPAFVPGLTECHILSADPAGRWDVREHLVEWIWFLPAVRSVFRSEYQKPFLIAFHNEGGDLSSLEGEWRLISLNSGRATRLSYRATVKLALPLPGAIVRDALEREVPKTLQALRAEVVRNDRR